MESHEIPTFYMSPASSNMPLTGMSFTHNRLGEQPITSRLAVGLVINIYMFFINLCIITGAGFECYVRCAV